MLPGKLCIGILEEDNPLKSYFRLKPLLVEAEGRYAPFEGADLYPEEGCIRIVPDKNESSHFKARMRRMGRFCVLDLRQHAGENDKIRPNKNYHGDETERNAHIVYSDVVREPADDMIFEILPEGDFSGEAPATGRVLKGESLETWAYTPPQGEEEAGFLALDGETLIAEEIQIIDIGGFPGEKLRFAIKLPATVESVVALPAAKPAPEPAAEPAKPRAAEAAPAPAVQEEKPWISHDLPPVPPQPVRQNLTPMQQALAAQSGLNPRRSRSLQEIIEEKWRHSRVDQLGHPVPVNATGQPVENPLEHALEAIRGAWHVSGLRSRLVSAIAEMPEFSADLDQRRQEISNLALKRELEDLEAERLKTLAEIDKLRRDKANLREILKQEIRQEEAAVLRDCIEKTRAAQTEQKKYEAAAAEAKQAAEFAQDAFASLNDGRFEEKLKEFALTSRAVQLLTQPEKKYEPAVIPSDEKPGREEWIARLQRAFAAEGLHISEVQAANLLICAALSDHLIISGKASSDKAIVGRALARSLGAVDSGNYAEFSGPQPYGMARKCCEEKSCLPLVGLVRQANNSPEADLTRGLLDGGREGLVISLISDGGYPVSAEALDHAFLIRLEDERAQTAWKSAARNAGAFSPVRLQALRDAFIGGEAELPVALERRLQRLRDALAEHDVHLSRRTLNLMWHYCAALLPLGKVSAGEALDYAFAQKALPCVLAEAPVECLAGLKTVLAGMPHSLALLEVPLPILI